MERHDERSSFVDVVASRDVNAVLPRGQVWGDVGVRLGSAPWGQAQWKRSTAAGTGVDVIGLRCRIWTVVDPDGSCGTGVGGERGGKRLEIAGLYVRGVCGGPAVRRGIAQGHTCRQRGSSRWCAAEGSGSRILATVNSILVAARCYHLAVLVRALRCDCALSRDEGQYRNEYRQSPQWRAEHHPVWIRGHSDEQVVERVDRGKRDRRTEEGNGQNKWKAWLCLPQYTRRNASPVVISEEFQSR